MIRTTIIPKLSTNYFQIIETIEHILNCCEKNKIRVCPEYNTYLTIKYDILAIPNREIEFIIDCNSMKLQSLLSKKEFIVDNKYYNDSCNKLIIYKSNPNFIINISIGNLENYSFNELLFGHIIFIPNNWKINSLQDYSKKYIFCDSKDELFFENLAIKIWNPIKKLRIDDFDEIINFIKTANEPVIFNKTKLLACDLKKFNYMINTQHTNIYGYQSSITWHQVEDTAQKVWHDYLTRNLTFNIVDSPIDDKSILGQKWNDFIHQKLSDKYEFALTWIFTISPKITHFHTDPEYAGGFMKLLTGKKIWWCICPCDYLFLVKHGHSVETMAKLKFHEIISLENNYLVGKIQTGILESDDMIWFPINTMHKVITVEDSYGFGGYL
ncbi:putative histone demethylase [Cotonvirus japonicus]|uniref:Histone demethylase n=1 Tax=Cotonvirus japonicus TaxID=2811091 RepID=A0ABM7NTD0_9VIRU|nr:putative histone demethylase [Cotonvirus japonicus]BCS83430.1 putative histone demethylase [Cotonvirus japonicus]